MIVFGRLSQEQIVFGLVVALCASFVLSLPGFMTANDILNLVQTVSILGILGVAMGLVVIGRGIDLSLVATMAITVAWALQASESGVPLPAALAVGTAVYGFGRNFLLSLDVIPIRGTSASARALTLCRPGALRGRSGA